MIITKYKRLTESETLDCYIIPKGYIIRCDDIPYYNSDDIIVLGNTDVPKKEENESVRDFDFKNNWIPNIKKN